jgi:hypothetical protein
MGQTNQPIKRAENMFSLFSPPPTIGQTKSANQKSRKYLLKGDILDFFMYDIQHCFICRPSDSTVSEDAGIEPRTVATTALAVRRSNHSARSHPLTRLDLIHNSATSHPQYFPAFSPPPPIGQQISQSKEQKIFILFFSASSYGGTCRKSKKAFFRFS